MNSLLIFIDIDETRHVLGTKFNSVKTNSRPVGGVGQIGRFLPARRASLFSSFRHKSTETKATSAHASSGAVLKEIYPTISIRSVIGIAELQLTKWLQAIYQIRICRVMICRDLGEIFVHAHGTTNYVLCWE
jgi:hypothetical protein